MIIVLMLAWYGFSTRFEFKLLPTGVGDDIEIKTVLDGRSVRVNFFNDSTYTINNFKLVCRVSTQSDDCSSVGVISEIALSQIPGAGKNRGSCLVVAGDVIRESLVRSYILPGTKINEYFEVNNLPSKTTMSCFAEDLRGYQSFWFERLIGRAMD